ncbi:hypothetical protein KAU19_02020 [Candidatus Parcubacteria bacterium]|nr:hypothetical protein [Candidatus Parcubacteria bacterium]
MRIIFGLIMFVGGALIVIKSEAILRIVGPVGWFERHLGTEGGSRLGYKLIGLFVCFIGLLIMTNMIGGFVMWFIGPVLKYMAPPG